MERRWASGGRDKLVRLWDVETGAKLLGTLEGPHGQSGEAWAWSWDGQVLASGSDDRDGCGCGEADGGVRVRASLYRAIPVAVLGIAWQPGGPDIGCHLSGRHDAAMEDGELRW